MDREETGPQTRLSLIYLPACSGFPACFLTMIHCLVLFPYLPPLPPSVCMFAYRFCLSLSCSLFHASIACVCVCVSVCVSPARLLLPLGKTTEIFPHQLSLRTDHCA
mmetsp:Transcript_17625/g.42362  ORF Transcript_17625/g.42362 Transcript_17625/m.42362 type:complete len:107 (+) Transcript_17625:991-1311(+)